MKVLIAEDELQNQKLLQRVLKMMNIDSVVCENGSDVIAQKECFDLLILDLTLPDMEGIDVAKYIRDGRTNQQPALPIILLSGKSASVMQSYCSEYKIDNYIEKPFGIDDLKQKVGDCLKL